jgi:hypothetical protein
MAPVKNISMKRGKLPTIITIDAVLQKETRIRQIAMMESIVKEQTIRIRIVDP